MSLHLSRRRLLVASSATLAVMPLAGCGTAPPTAPAPPAPRLDLPVLRAGTDLITDINVCLRPFRARGPRIERERIGSKDVIHHYGHGGSGWSLCWGSGEMAVGLAMATGTRTIAVIGCGAIGLTTAILLQRAGAEVTIYTKDMPPEVPSAWASGVWSPDSRICLDEHATPAFKAAWEGMCRRSFKTYQSMLGLAERPVEWVDTFYISNPGQPPHRLPEGRPRFAELRRELTPDLSIGRRVYDAGRHPFGERTVRASRFMMFNIAPYFRMLMADFLRHGGRIEIRSFQSPADFAGLPQPTLVNCTGYGARALLGDESVVPVRGQLARTPPQPGIDYALYHANVSFVPRRDGFVYQYTGPDDYHGYGETDLTPDRAEAERAVTTIAGLFPQA